MLNKRVLWWGRLGNYGPDYPRNRTIQAKLRDLGCEVIEFQPKISKLANIEAALKGFEKIDLVWVPCFRQRDLVSAKRWADKRGIRVVFDPLISAYDKRVYEKQKYAPGSLRARRLHRWESKLFAMADIVIADTQAHAAYFAEEFDLPLGHFPVIPVSAEEALFKPDPKFTPNEVCEFLFFGTFIGLQGTEFIARSLAYYQGPPIKVTLMGEGPEKEACEKIAATITSSAMSVSFEGWVPIDQLPARICRADVCLGIFGSGKKTQRVIPNKVYQALACGKPVITLKSPAYPDTLLTTVDSPIVFLDQLDSDAFVDLLKKTAQADLVKMSSDARRVYDEHFSNAAVSQQLVSIMNALT